MDPMLRAILQTLKKKAYNKNKIILQLSLALEILVADTFHNWESFNLNNGIK